MKNISIIVTIYYGEKYIADIIRQVKACRECLEEQDYVEVLFINDAPGAPLVQKWESDSINIIVENTDRNVGIHGARVKGLEKCHGEYVLFLDQDDIIEPEYLCSQICAIGKNDAVVCRAIHGKELFYSEHNIFENILSKDLMLAEWNKIVSPGQVLLRKKSIPDIWIENILKHNGADDWFLWLCMMARKCSFTLNQEVLYEHVLTGKNTSDNVVSMLESEQEMMRIVQEKKLFSDRDYKLLMDGFFLRNTTRTRGLDFAKKKLDIIGKWINLKENNIKYSEFLLQAGLKKIAIYGCGILGEYLYAEMKNDVNVKYFIDKNAKNIHKEIPVYSLQDNLPEVDGIIVTLVGETDEVVKELRENTKGTVLILKYWFS